MRLVTSVHRLANFFFTPGNEQLTRQWGQSLLGDGVLASTFLQDLTQALETSLSEDLPAAEAAGDIASPIEPETAGLMALNLFSGLQLCLLPEKTAGAFRCPRFELVRRSTRFALRGGGLKPSAIDRDYHPEALSPLP